MSKPRSQQLVRGARKALQPDAPSPPKVFGRYYDRVRQRWMTLTDAGPIPEAPVPAVRVDM